jgi:pyridoxamine 5'-phosphate oxidase
MRGSDPIRLFTLWFRAAVKRSATDLDPVVMTLATAGKDGRVTARMVLLRKFGPEGFTFFSNYDSRKGRQLSENPRAALVFYWHYLHRQVRIEGTVERISREESEQYFHSRPRLHQLAAAVSAQSGVIPSRKFLMDRFRRLRKELGGRTVPLPKNWGGYRLVPDSMEFWQHRVNRLHERFRYSRNAAGKWTCELLAP